MSRVLRLYILTLAHDFVAAQSPTLPRWGQAAAVIQNTLYIHGGRTDLYNSYSYSSAPVTNDLFSLSLSSSFNASSPPWQYTGGCSNCTASQGPSVAWHTLSAFNTSGLLLFGGDPGPNSAIVLPEKADSAVLLDADSLQDPSWNFVSESWANEPLRRIYHSASSTGGKIWLVGGLKADGSDNALSDHYVFDPTVPSFTQIPSADGPLDVCGHASVVLSNGKLLVFGGYSPSQQSLIPLSTIWVLDTTQSTLSWNTLSVSNATLPISRRGFAATLLSGDKVLIQGGADADLQTSMSDGWILDTTQSPMVWTSVDALSELGPRRDHLAVAVGSAVIFGFGYSTNGAAPANLSIFDTLTSTFLSGFTPSASGTIPTTLPGSIPSSTATGSPGSDPSHTVSGGGGTGTATGSHPTSSSTGNNGNGSGENGSPSSSDDPGSHTTAIALGSVLGVIGLLVGTSAATYYMRRRRRSQPSFRLLSPSSENNELPHLEPAIPTAGAIGTRQIGLPMSPVMRSVRDRLGGFVLPGRGTITQQQERRDMLADEDTRQFGEGWRSGGLRRDTSSGRSSWNRHTLGDRMHDSLASLRNVSGALLGYASGARSLKTREGSGGSRSTAWRVEKEASDPFADDWALIKGVPVSKNASRPRGGRQASSYTYHDPFDDDDYEVESLKIADTDAYVPDYHDNVDDAERGVPSLSDPPPRPYLRTAFPTAGIVDLTHLTPVSERPSLSTLTESNSTPTDSSHAIPLSPFLTTAFSSNSLDTSTSYTPRSPPPRPSSIIDANPAPSVAMRRSNSWWTRFAKTPLLDRRSSDASRLTQPLDFRDPNPPPTRLVPIEESNSPETPKRGGSGDSGSGSGHVQVYSTHLHGRSASSLQTAGTANSEMIERMGRTMDIVQKESTMSSQLSGQSYGAGSEDSPPDDREVDAVTKPLSVVTSSESNRSDTGEDEVGMLVQSPEDMRLESSFATIRGYSPASPSPASPPSLSPTSSSIPRLPRVQSPPQRPPSSGKVAARIQAYERRMTEQAEPLKSPPPARSRTHRASIYGVAPKPSLFVANPDHKGSPSSDS